MTCLAASVDMPLSAADAALVSTIYNPPRARHPWMVKDVLPDGTTRYYSLARWALVDALRVFGVRSGDRVLIPGLFCREALASVNLLGAVPTFYPVSRDLSGELDGETPVAKAVLAVNYFGFPQNLLPFRTYCERTGAALIEDNAHGLLSRDDTGELLGSRGDAGIFSFRKTLAVPDGGVLVVTGNRSLPREIAVMPPTSALNCRYRLKQAFRRVAGHLGPVRTQTAIGGFRRLRQALTGDALPVGASDGETRIPSSPNPSKLISGRLTVAEPELETGRRRALYGVAGRLVESSGALPVFPRLPGRVVPYGFPMFASQPQASEIVAALGRYGCQVSRWPDLPEVVAPRAPEHYRQLMVLPFLW